MAEESSDRKKISELYFGYSEAEEGLKKINEQLKKLNGTSKTVFDNVQKGMENSFNIGNSNISNNVNKELTKISGYTTEFGKKMKYTINSVDFSKMLDVQKFQKDFDNLESLGKNRTANIANYAIKSNIKVQENRRKESTKTIEHEKRNESDINKEREIQAIREESRNKRLAESSKTMYDKIASYAKTYLIYQGFNELRNAAKELITEMVEVENQMVQIDRVLNDSSLDINKYREQLIQLAYDYGNSFDNVADITLRLAQAGLDSEQAISLTEKTLLALNTAELDATEATSDMVAIMSQWNLMTGSATEVSEEYATIIDKINRVADNFPTTSADILDALKKTSSAFNLAGASIDETIASIVAAEKASQRGGKAIGTALNSIIQQLRTEGRLATMESLGIEIYTDENKNEFKPLMEIFEQLAEKMDQLKKAGKESSVEMQDLMSVFTVLRRNIGSSLLGEMAGEDSTYQKVLGMVQAYDTIGYSLQENEKYMGTAKAAIEQFNAELLKLKTAIWDNGGEDVFRSLIILGKEIVEVFTELVKAFGSGETAISLIIDILEILAKTLEMVGDGFEKIREATKFIQEINDKFENGGIVAQGFSKYFSALKDIFKATNPAMSTVIDVLDNLIIKEKETEESTEELSDKFEEVKSNGIEAVNSFNKSDETFSSINSILKTSIDTLDNYTNQYSMLKSAIDEFNSSGGITVETFQKLVDNNLLQYLDVVNGKLKFNSEALLESANTAKEKAIADVQAQAAAEILAIAQADYNNTLTESTGPANVAKKNAEEAGNAALNSAKKALVGASSWKEFYNALENNSDKLYYSGLSENAQKQIDKVLSNANKTISAINSISLSAAKSSSGASRSATKTFEEQSSERVKIFKKEIDDLESLEKSWVNKYKKLELFSTSDLKFITHQRINRYNEYLNQINQLQGISEEDRTELVREYSSKRQEAELEYFDLLKQQLDDQIKAFEDANKERIQQIKDQAQAQIDALQKVEDENDRIRQKEEYLRKRDELIHGNQGIEYWQQRTGREAQIALAEAQKELEDLDRDWEEKKEEWNLDDQVEQIEKARDAQIAAIEEAQEQQIQGWKNAYEAQVQLYAQTGQIIYDDSIINANYLYNAYMDNFVTPFHAQIQNVVNSINQASAAADNVISKMNTISGGGGSTASVSSSAKASIHTAQVASGHVPKAVAAAHSYGPSQQIVTDFNKIIKKSGLAMFHGGGKVGSSTEGLALLRPNEVVLTPEWAARHEQTSAFNK